MGGLVTTTQPPVFPPLYLVERIAQCSTVIVLGESQFDRQHMRMKFMLHDRPNVESVPVSGSARRPFDVLTVAEHQNWIRKLESKLKSGYGKCQYYGVVMEALQPLLQIESNRPEVRLDTLGMDSIQWVVGVLKLDTQVLLSKTLVPRRPENASQWLSDLVDSVGSYHYLQGKVGYEKYIDTDKFSPDVMLWYQDFTPEWDASFCVLDMMMREGFDATREKLVGDANRRVWEL